MTNLAVNLGMASLRYTGRLVDMAVTSFVNGFAWFMIFFITVFVLNGEFRRCVSEQNDQISAQQSTEALRDVGLSLAPNSGGE